MNRRDFIKLTLASGAVALMPTYTYASTLDLEKISFSANENNAQTILIFLAGGPSQLGGNLTNLEEIKKRSTNNYGYFKNITLTKNACWKQAGGDAMETLMENGDMTLFRSCYSKKREKTHNKAHGMCSKQNQRGSQDPQSGGIINNLAKILHANDVIKSDAVMPFVTMSGENQFYHDKDRTLVTDLRPIGISSSFSNPYKRERIYRGSYYKYGEKKYNKEHNITQPPALNQHMNILAEKTNRPGKIREVFTKRGELDDFINKIKKSKTPDLGDNAYQKNNFANTLQAAVKILVSNADTRVITVGTGGLGGWDQHNNALHYVDRMNNLFNALKSAMAHIKAEGKEQTINIMVFGEFGRNVNLNRANGWDHGNLQNFYLLGGKGYFNHKGIVGETVVEGKKGRIYHRPKEGTYWFEPFSIAATFYKIYGIENPEELTGGHGVIESIFS